MANECAKCGGTESQTTADANTLGLLQGFQRRVYTCCQITEWADEQRLAWFEAIHEDSQLIDEQSIQPELRDADVVFVPVRFRRPQVPWYRSPDVWGLAG
jgi:hypothetical protein